ncbi:DEKNAAC100307 [Brettanomyces naardenensis]|uniref:DEKNAAC100307 n=1 Tax=Brettanomyces naardenensis TaxID=13370 RepID=A0A448YGA0_BRENA|nr:DEKNAAC100307 [Brettanomyces naardenensis]
MPSTASGEAYRQGKLSLSGKYSSSKKNRSCSICNKVFNRPSGLRIHMHTHTGEKPFKCEWPNCGKRFSVRSNMIRHLKIHKREERKKRGKEQQDGGSEVEATEALNEGVFIEQPTKVDIEGTKEKGSEEPIA